MTEFAQTSETQIERIARNKRLFFGAWGKDHSVDIPSTGFLVEHPSQAIDVIKSPSKLPSEEESLEDIVDRITFTLYASFEDKARAPEFLEVLHRPYPFEGGEGRSYIQYIHDEYLAKGLSVGGLLVHADDGLTDVPRQTAITKAALAKQYGDAYLSNVGEVASPTLQFETYMGIPVPDLLELIGETYWMPPNTDSAETLRKRLGLKEEEFLELYSYLALAGAKKLRRDIAPKVATEDGVQEPGRIVYISPPGTRSESEVDENGKVISVVTPEIPQASADIISHFAGLWAVTIVNEEIRLGPIVRMPAMEKGLPKEERKAINMQIVEDMIELIDEQLDDIIGAAGAGQYARKTPRGNIFLENSRKAGAAAAIGSRTLRSAT